MILRRLGFPLAFAALFLAAGGHWMVLQTIAWGRMWVDYSSHAGARQALVQTFDGAHLCPLCKAVMRGAEKEKKADPSLIAPIKAEVFLASNHVLIFPAAPFLGRLIPPASSLSPFSSPPLLRPPRASLV